MGQKQHDGDFGLPRRPPARLVMLDCMKDGDDRESLLEDLRVEAREVQSRLKEQLKQFRIEVDIYLRLMYKNKNQHRHSLYYRRMLQVRRDLRLLDFAALDETLEGFTRWTLSFKQSRLNVEQSNQDKNQVSSALCILLSATRILNQIDQPILAASTQILGLLSQSFFMSLSLTVFSTLARLRVLSQQMLFEFATLYNLLSVFSKDKPNLSNQTAHLSLVTAEVRRTPPPLHLECQWDGGKLCITEIEPPTEVFVSKTVPLATPLSSGSWFVDDRLRLGVSKNILKLPIVGPEVSTAGVSWLAEDRTGVKYDVRVSAVTAREEPLGKCETTQSESSFLQKDYQGAAVTRQISVTKVSSESVKDEKKVNTSSSVTRSPELCTSLTSADELTPGPVAEVSAVSATEGLIKVGITGAADGVLATSAEISVTSGPRADDRSNEISQNASPLETVFNSEQGTAVNDKFADAKERVGKARKKKRHKGDEGKTRQESLKRKDESNDKVPQRKEVDNLLNMLLGGL